MVACDEQLSRVAIADSSDVRKRVRASHTRSSTAWADAKAQRWRLDLISAPSHPRRRGRRGAPRNAAWRRPFLVDLAQDPLHEVLAADTAVYGMHVPHLHLQEGGLCATTAPGRTQTRPLPCDTLNTKRNTVFAARRAAPVQEVTQCNRQRGSRSRRGATGWRVWVRACGRWSCEAQSTRAIEAGPLRRDRRVHDASERVAQCQGLRAQGALGQRPELGL
jgi:hypothetical protein